MACILNVGVIQMSGRSTEQAGCAAVESDETRVSSLKRELKKGGSSRSPKTLSTAVKRYTAGTSFHNILHQHRLGFTIRKPPRVPR